MKVLGLKRERGLDGSFDFTGFLGISLLFGGLLLSINRAAHQQSLSGSVGGLLAALAGVALLWRAATHAASPIVDWGLFSRRNYLLALTLGMVRSFGLFGSVFLLPIYLQKVAGLDAMHTALLILPAALSLAAASPLVGRLTGRFDTRLLAPVGIVLISLSMIWLRDLGPVAPLGLIVTSQIVRGLGMSLLITPVMTVAMNDMPGERVGTASGLITITMQLGGALGVAVLNGAMVNRSQALGLSGELVAGDPLAAQAFGHAFQLASLVNFVGLVPALAFLPVAQPSPQQEARA